MPDDVDLAVAARVPPLREPLATSFRELGSPVPTWLQERVTEVRAGLYAGPRPAYLIWIKGTALDAGMRARLLLSPDWFYVSEPFPHFRSVDSAAVLPGNDVLILTNLLLANVLKAFAAGAFSIPAAAASEEETADLLLIVPDLTAALAGLASDSGLDGMTARFGTDNLWLFGAAADGGLDLSAEVGTGDKGVARILEVFGGRAPALEELRLQAQGTALTLSGLMPYDQLIGVALLVLGPARAGPVRPEGGQ